MFDPSYDYREPKDDPWKKSKDWKWENREQNKLETPQYSASCGDFLFTFCFGLFLLFLLQLILN